METINPIYSGKREDFHWAGFGSGAGTNLQQCAKIIKPSLIVTDRPKAALIHLPELQGLAKVIGDGYSACGSWQKAKGNKELEGEYKKRSEQFNELILNRIRLFEDVMGYSIDLIVLGGYMRLITEPLLSAFKDRIINVHPARLDVLDYNGKRRYVGPETLPIRKALLDEDYTRSSVILVDEREDHGEILVTGPRVNATYICKGLVRSGSHNADDYLKDHQRRQKEVSDWPALTTALEMIADGRLAVGTERKHHDEWRQIYLAGAPLPYEGHVMHK